MPPLHASMQRSDTLLERRCYVVHASLHASSACKRATKKNCVTLLGRCCYDIVSVYKHAYRACTEVQTAVNYVVGYVCERVFMCCVGKKKKGPKGREGKCYENGAFNGKDGGNLTILLSVGPQLVVAG